MEIEVVKKETIKPSFPTPNHLRSLKLSLLDQFGPIYHSPILFFFPMNTNQNASQDLNFLASKRSRTLKQSLSITLNHFYPLAGRISPDNFSVDCNDEGAEFVEARVKFRLSKILADPNPEALEKLIPPTRVARDELFTSPLLRVQSSFFECGGMTVGACFSHKIADGSTISRHLKCWAAVASSGPGAASPFVPQFVSPSIFPPHDFFASKFQGFEDPNPEKTAIRRLVFRRQRIAALRSKLASSTTWKPTRVEAVLALIWKCVTEASDSASGSRRPSVLFQTVDLRKRFAPPLPESCAGNLIWMYGAESPGVNEMALQRFVVELRKGLEDFKKSCDTRIGLKEVSNFIEVFRSHKKNGDVYSVSSRCRFPFYEVNFGWGKPSWVCFPSTSGKNVIIMMDTADGDGIEVTLSLGEEEMASFERKQELLEYASFKNLLSAI